MCRSWWVCARTYDVHDTEHPVPGKPMLPNQRPVGCRIGIRLRGGSRSDYRADTGESGPIVLRGWPNLACGVTQA